MKVAFLQRFFAHYQWGLVQELTEHGEHEYSFYGDTRDPSGSGIETIPKGRLQQVSFTPARTWQLGRRVAFQPAAVRAALQGRCDVLILEGSVTHPTAWAAMKLAQRRGKRVLLHTHGWTRQREQAGIEPVRTLFLGSADGLLLYGQRAKAIGVARGVAAEKMHVVYNCLDHRQIVACRSGVDDAALCGFRSAVFGDPNCQVVAYVGRVRREKGLELALQALTHLTTHGMRPRFLVIGGGPAVAGLREVSDSLGIRSHFAGPEYEEEGLAVMLSASRVVVAPEAAGLAVVHAMSYGTPVITHGDFDKQGPEAEAVVSGVTGELFSRGDVADLADKLSRFLSPDDARARYSQHCVELVDRYYNPGFMRRVFDRAVNGLPASDERVFSEAARCGATDE